ncbi:hypothetical protein RRG08_047926 [Elysia crispata]|uniref:Uncharacterized protein n=1 Tax=Elysia crispata TaxID=231223 RepID=A0AAE1DJ33_9GAST|nr:hypothetical protein RRG08_047926 [Elysia crispata]
MTQGSFVSSCYGQIISSKLENCYVAILLQSAVSTNIRADARSSPSTYIKLRRKAISPIERPATAKIRTIIVERTSRSCFHLISALLFGKVILAAKMRAAPCDGYLQASNLQDMSLIKSETMTKSDPDLSQSFATVHYNYGHGSASSDHSPAYSLCTMRPALLTRPQRTSHPCLTSVAVVFTFSFSRPHARFPTPHRLLDLLQELRLYLACEVHQVITVNVDA